MIPEKPIAVNEKKLKRWHKVVLCVILAAALLSGITAVSINMWYSNNLEPLSSGRVVEKRVEVAVGMNSTQIADLLVQNGIIKNARAFNWYVSRQGLRPKLQAGAYKFSPTQSVPRIVEMLVNGEVDTASIRIPSGQRLDQLKTVFKKAGFSDAEIDAGLVADQYRSHPSLKDLPAGATLEGYIYPETFVVDSTSTVKQVVDLALSELDVVITPELMAKLKARGFTLHEAVILASIIEKETSTVVDQPKVAQVFEKRLREGIMLGSDVTFIYAAAVSGQTASPSLDSPYNTRKYTGLPPGPISNFMLSSLQAVAEPADTDYLYFVAGDDGKTYYARTLAEHDANIAAHCHTLCQ